MPESNDQQGKKNKQKVDRKKEGEKRLAYHFIDRMQACQININHLFTSAKRL